MACSDDDVTWAEKVPPRSAAPGSLKKRKAASSGDLAADDDEAMCFLCQEVGDNLVREWRGVRLHKNCWNGVRAYRRLLTTSSAKHEELQRFQKDPDAWRQDVSGMVVDVGQLRSVKARQDARQAIKEFQAEEDYEAQEKIMDSVLLTKDRYKRFKRKLGGYIASEASEDFHDKLGQADSANENTDGEPQIEVREPTKLRKVTGRKISKVKRTQEARERGERGRAASTLRRQCASDRLCEESRKASESSSSEGFLVRLPRRPVQTPRAEKRVPLNRGPSTEAFSSSASASGKSPSHKGSAKLTR